MPARAHSYDAMIVATALSRSLPATCGAGNFTGIDDLEVVAVRP